MRLTPLKVGDKVIVKYLPGHLNYNKNIGWVDRVISYIDTEKLDFFSFSGGEVVDYSDQAMWANAIIIKQCRGK